MEGERSGGKDLEGLEKKKLPQLKLYTHVIPALECLDPGDHECEDRLVLVGGSQYPTEAT